MLALSIRLSLLPCLARSQSLSRFQSLSLVCGNAPFFIFAHSDSYLWVGDPWRCVCVCVYVCVCVCAGGLYRVASVCLCYRGEVGLRQWVLLQPDPVCEMSGAALKQATSSPIA